MRFADSARAVLASVTEEPGSCPGMERANRLIHTDRAVLTAALKQVLGGAATNEHCF